MMWTNHKRTTVYILCSVARRMLDTFRQTIVAQVQSPTHRLVVWSSLLDCTQTIMSVLTAELHHHHHQQQQQQQQHAVPHRAVPVGVGYIFDVVLWHRSSSWRASTMMVCVMVCVVTGLACDSCYEFMMSNLPISTRGHAYKLVQRYSRVDSRKQFFAERITKPWNSLPADTDTFKSILLMA